MKPKYLIFLLPSLLFIEIYIFSWIAELLRQPSDIAVGIGVTIACAFFVGNYFLITYIIKTIKNKIK